MKGRVLVVDDEKAMVLALKGLLSKEGYQVETAGSGEEALAAVRDRQLPSGDHRSEHGRRRRHAGARTRPRHRSGSGGDHDHRVRLREDRRAGHEARGVGLPSQAVRQRRAPRRRAARDGDGAAAPRPPPLAGASAERLRLRPDHRPQPGHAPHLRNHRQDRRHRRDRVDPRRERHRQGAGGQRAALPQPAPQPRR